ncbi:MAG TPA: hypothetical protein VKB12_07710 [Pyrinomonadaceae bacterium]|nr:hypothetical protein [Pyrinomonadaceae bacterium]
MRLSTGRTLAALLAVLALTRLGADAAATAPRYVVPNPVLVLTGTELYETGGKNFIRYRYLVFNSSEYPDSMFAAAPNLPPCGKNANSSRTWVDIYDQSGKRLYGFCSFGKSSDLNQLWFALEEGVLPPSWVYIELNDRNTNTKYKSNLAETSL